MDMVNVSRSTAQYQRRMRLTPQTWREGLFIVTCVTAFSACSAETEQTRDITVSAAPLLRSDSASAGAAAPDTEAQRAADGKQWHEPVVLGLSLGDARVPSLAVTERGDALIGWAQTDRLGVHVETVSYSADAGWNEASILSQTVGDAEQVHVTLADAEHGLLVWNERPNPLQVVGLSTTWSMTDGYGPIKELLRYDPTIAFTYGPRFAGHADGRAIALWGYSVGRGVAIQAFRYEPEAGWGALVKLELDPAATRQPIVQDADVALSARAVAFTAFSSYGEPWVNRSTAQNPVGAVTRLAAAVEGSGAVTPSIASDGYGRALAVWRKREPGRESIMAARYMLGRWGTPATLMSMQVPIDEGPTGPSQARALFNAWRQPCAAFIRPDPQHADVWASCYTGWRWMEPMHLDVGDAGESQSLQVAADGMGGWVAVWSRFDGASQHIYANRYTLGRGWSGPQRLDPEPGDSKDPVVGLDRAGNGFAAWTQSVGYTRVFASRLE